MANIRIGFAGGGNITETHARAARELPGVAIAAFCGANQARTARLAAQYGARAYDDYDAFLKHRPLDMVAIGSPSGLHAQQGIAAARQGLHVLVEKPLDVTTDRADALISAAAAAGIKLGVFFQDRLRPAVLEIKRMVDTREIGTPVMISGRVKWYRPPEYYSGSRWRGTWALDGGGALMNQAIHTIDLMLWLFGPVARVVGCTATRVHAIEVEDTAAAVLEFASGALGTIEAATSIFPGYNRRLEVTGSQGTLVLDHDRLVSVELRDAAARAASAESAAASESAASPMVSDASAHRRVLEDFIHAVETDGIPACDGLEGRRSVELVEAIYESARLGKSVHLIRKERTFEIW